MLLSTSLLCNLPLISSALAAPTNEGQYGGWHSSYAKRAATCSVKTTSGNVQGHLSSIAPDVHEYLGIPYGKSTAGDLRWAAPQPFSGEGDLPGDKYVSYWTIHSLGLNLLI